MKNNPFIKTSFDEWQKKNCDKCKKTKNFCQLHRALKSAAITMNASKKLLQRVGKKDDGTVADVCLEAVFAWPKW